MKAVLDHDIIRHITERGDTEIGNIPPDKKPIGLERLRFDGEWIVDLADLTEIWVKHIGEDYFELHAIEVPGSQLVGMHYRDRIKLTIDEGIIRLKTDEELQAESRARKIAQAGNRLARKLNRDIGGLERQLLDAYKLILALIVYARLQPQQLANFFDLLIPEIKDTFPLERVRDELIGAAKSLKSFVDEYYQEIDKI